jgi:hypothetical protein
LYVLDGQLPAHDRPSTSTNVLLQDKHEVEFVPKQLSQPALQFLHELEESSTSQNCPAVTQSAVVKASKHSPATNVKAPLGGQAVHWVDSPPVQASQLASHGRHC